MKSPIRYYGGKGGMLKEIIKYFPDVLSYKIYLEAFGGGGSLLFGKEISPIEIYNDLEENVYSLFKTISNPDEFKKFKEKADLCYFSRKIRDEFEKDLKSNKLDTFDRAFKYWYVNRTSYSGSGGFSVNTSVRRGISKSTSDLLATVENLPNIHNRLSTTVIENKNGILLVEKYSNEDTFMYLDPPYYPSTRTPAKYKCDMTCDDHKNLIDILLKTKAKVLLSGYDNEQYERLCIKGWERIDFNVNTITNKRVPKKKIESLWKNY